MRVQVRIKQIAEQQGLSASSLARKSGVNVHTVEQLFENGNAESIRVSTLARIGEALGVPTCDLLVDGAREE